MPPWETQITIEADIMRHYQIICLVMECNASVSLPNTQEEFARNSSHSCSVCSCIEFNQETMSEEMLSENAKLGATRRGLILEVGKFWKSGMCDQGQMTRTGDPPVTFQRQWPLSLSLRDSSMAPPQEVGPKTLSLQASPTTLSRHFLAGHYAGTCGNSLSKYCRDQNYSRSGKCFQELTSEKLLIRLRDMPH